MSKYDISVKELLEAGVHFGHKVSKWNPKMAKYIYCKRNMVHLLDVKETVKGLIRACHFAENLAKKGELLLFVGTKRQAKSVIEKEARRCGMPFVSERWPGGLLTNYSTVRSRLEKLLEIERWEQDETINSFVKKEVSAIMRLKRKLLRNLDGIRNMTAIPKAVFVIDPNYEEIAVRETNTVGAVTVGLIDTDGDPDNIDIKIPGNDDSMKVIQIVVSKIADAILAGKGKAATQDVQDVQVPVEANDEQ